MPAKATAKRKPLIEDGIQRWKMTLEVSVSIKRQSTVHVYSYLAYNADKASGEVWHQTIKKIHDGTGVSESVVSEAIQELESRKLLTRRLEKRHRGRWESTVYTLLQPPDDNRTRTRNGGHGNDNQEPYPENQARTVPAYTDHRARPRHRNTSKKIQGKESRTEDSSNVAAESPGVRRSQKRRSTNRSTGRIKRANGSAEPISLARISKAKLIKPLELEREIERERRLRINGS